MWKGQPRTISKKLFTIRAVKALEETGCFDEGQENEDFLGLREEMALFEQFSRTHHIQDLDFGPRMDGVVLVGRLKERNLRNMFETRAVAKRMQYNPSTGQMEPRPVKDPELEDWVNLTIEDETGVCVCTVGRYQYPKMKAQVWEKLEEGMLIRVEGWKSDGFKKLNISKIGVAKGEK